MCPINCVMSYNGTPSWTRLDTNLWCKTSKIQALNFCPCSRFIECHFDTFIVLLSIIERTVIKIFVLAASAILFGCASQPDDIQSAYPLVTGRWRWGPGTRVCTPERWERGNRSDVGSKKCSINFGSGASAGLTSIKTASSVTPEQTSSAPLNANAELIAPRVTEDIDGRILASLLQESTASGSIQSCEPSGFVGHQTRSEIKIDFRNNGTANIKIEYDWSHYVSSIRENFNANWSVKSDKLCLSNVPKNPSTVTNRCSKMVFENLATFMMKETQGWSILS